MKIGPIEIQYSEFAKFFPYLLIAFAWYEKKLSTNTTIICYAVIYCLIWFMGWIKECIYIKNNTVRCKKCSSKDLINQTPTSAQFDSVFYHKTNNGKIRLQCVKCGQKHYKKDRFLFEANWNSNDRADTY
jgi:hypothetical protein